MRRGMHDKYWDAGFGYTFHRACKLWDTYCQCRETKKCMVSAFSHFRCFQCILRGVTWVKFLGEAQIKENLH